MRKIITQAYNYDTLLVINDRGKLACIYVPFKVISLVELNGIPEGTQVYVDGVLPHIEYMIAFAVNGNWYPYYFFKLQATF
jgi:hypothetical protein